MEKVNIELIKIFGPSVLKVSIPETIVNNLNNYIDEIIKNKERSKELDIGERLVGDVTQEFEIEQKIMQESGWGQFLSNCVSKWIEIETKSKITKFQILKSWVVRHREEGALALTCAQQRLYGGSFFFVFFSCLICFDRFCRCYISTICT